MLTLSNPPDVAEFMGSDLNDTDLEDLGMGLNVNGAVNLAEAPGVDPASSLTAQIEAILYLKAQPLTLAAIAEYANCDRAAAQEALTELLMDYAHRGSALEVVETETGYSLQLRAAFEHLVHRLVPVNLGVGALRTLAMIALKGPIPQSDLVELRGSGVYQQVPELVEQGFISKRRQPNGRSFSLQVTEQFHQYFQLDRAQLERLSAAAPAKSNNSDAAVDPEEVQLETGDIERAADLTTP